MQTVRRYPGEVTIVAVGPLQDIADAMRKEPNLGKYVKRVALMNGCVYGTASKPGIPIGVAETAAPGKFFNRRETLPLIVDDQGYTLIDPERGKPVTVCLDPKRDEFMKSYLYQLTSPH